MAKKYYWLKLKNDFFTQPRIKKLRRIAGGDTYTIIYLKMQLLSLKDGGKLYFDGIENNFAEEIALTIDEDVENVKVTIQFLLSQRLMVETVSDSEYLMTETQTIIGSDSESKERVAEYRKRKQEQIAQKNVTRNANIGQSVHESVTCNADVTECNARVTKCNTEIDIEKEIELEIEQEIEQEIELEIEQEQEIEQEIELEIEQEQEIELEEEHTNCFGASSPKRTRTHYEEIKRYFNKYCTNFPAIREITEGRKKNIRAFLKSHDIADLYSVFDTAQNSAFLSGQTGKGWQASFDWLIKPANALKVLEGNYTDKMTNNPFVVAYNKLAENENEEGEDIDPFGFQ